MGIQIKRIETNTVLTKSKLPEAEYVINPYIGCMHACSYCYARFMGRFTGHAGQPWGSYVDVKLFSREKLQRQIERLPAGTSVFLGSVTDAYQAVEREQRVTRKILGASLRGSVALSTLTKSDLVVRDIDLWSRIPGASVGFSISTVDDRLAAIFERRTMPVSRRLEAMAALHRAGIDVYVFVGPILPTVTNLSETMSAVAKHCTGVMAEVLNLKCGNRANLEAVISAHCPDMQENFFRLASDSSYWLGLREEYEHLCDSLGIRNLGFFDHSGVMISKPKKDRGKKG